MCVCVCADGRSADSLLSRACCSVLSCETYICTPRDSRKALLMNEPEISAGSITVFKDSQLLPKVREAARPLAATANTSDIGS